MANERILFLVLAGGEGKRLLTLTYKRAKPAILFGGKYRIIDFVLSNAINAGIREIGILTQYQPDSLIKHFGFAWNLDRDFHRFDLLIPPTREDTYIGTAHAVRMRQEYIEDKNPDLVVVVPGDYVSIIDYRQIIQFHVNKKADLTIAGTFVQPKDTKNYGMMKTDSDDRITFYVEKPQEEVDTNFASMGIYVFNTNVLLRKLNEMDSETPNLDFTYKIIPELVAEGNAYGFKFIGYWRDVGTIQSYFEANQELINIMPQLNLYDHRNPIRSRIRFEAPAKICENAYIKSSLITQACIIDGRVERSIIFPHVKINKGAEIYDSIIMPNNQIGEGTIIKKTIIDTTTRQRFDDENPNIGRGCIIGGWDNTIPNKEFPKYLNTGITLIGMESSIPDGMKIGKNCIIWPNTSKEDLKSINEIPDGESFYNASPQLKKYIQNLKAKL